MVYKQNCQVGIMLEIKVKGNGPWKGLTVSFLIHGFSLLCLDIQQVHVELQQVNTHFIWLKCLVYGLDKYNYIYHASCDY